MWREIPSANSRTGPKQRFSVLSEKDTQDTVNQEDNKPGKNPDTQMIRKKASKTEKNKK